MGRSTGIELDREKLAPLFGELFPIGRDELPERVLGWFTRVGRLRRARADYPNGWRLVLNFNAKGEISSIKSTLSLICTGQQE